MNTNHRKVQLLEIVFCIITVLLAQTSIAVAAPQIEHKFSIYDDLVIDIELPDGMYVWPINGEGGITKIGFESDDIQNGICGTIVIARDKSLLEKDTIQDLVYREKIWGKEPAWYRNCQWYLSRNRIEYIRANCGEEGPEEINYLAVQSGYLIDVYIWKDRDAKNSCITESNKKEAEKFIDGIHITKKESLLEKIYR